VGDELEALPGFNWPLNDLSLWLVTGLLVAQWEAKKAKARGRPNK
jgi:hypothetical protein